MEALVVVALVVLAVDLWRRGDPSRGATRIDARWWAGAVAVGTLAALLLLDVVRRAARLRRRAAQRRGDALRGRHRQADWEP